MIRKFIFASLLLCLSASLSAQTNVTSLVKNFSFESGLDNWKNDGFQAQNNTAFTLKSGEWYAEKWTPEGGRLDDATLSQTLEELTAGTYTLTVRGQHIQQANTAQTCTGVEFFLGDVTTAVNAAKTYSVTCTIITSTTDIGIRVMNATGNWVACDHFMLSYEFKSEETDKALQRLIDSANDLKASTTYTGNALAELDEAIKACEKVFGSTSAEDITTTGDRLTAAITAFRLASATTENPLDMTNLIVNPSFEKGLTGWTSKGFQSQDNTAFSRKSGNFYAESWVGRGRQLGGISLSTSITDAPHGRYILKAAAHHINEDAADTPQTGVVLFGEAGQTDVTSADDYQIEFVHIENTLNIGLEGEYATGNWVATDNYRLYFAGNGDDVIQGEMQRRIDEAKSLETLRMNQSTLSNLQNYINRAEQSTSASFSNNAALLRVAINAARKSSDAYSQLENELEESQTLLDQGWENGEDDMRDAISLATAVFNDLTSSVADLREQKERLEGAQLSLRLMNGSGTAPTVITDSRYARGNNRIFARMSSSGANIIEEGFCYSTDNTLPTIADKRATRWIDSAGRIYVIENLTPGTIYYIRAYAITSTDNIGYGDVVKAVTIPASNIHWYYENNGNAEENARINAGMNGWYEYWSQLTSINGYNPSVRIATGTPTADCSYGGWCQVGTNAGFQQQATLTHEMLHGIGVGTHNVWWGAGGLRANGDRGVWLGDRVTEVLTFWHNAYTVLDGDNTHMWPWGFNYASEDPHTEAGYSINALVAQALGEDGLPPTGGFPSAYYAFVQDNNRKYYLTNEEVNHGLGTALLGVASNGTIRWIEANAAEALENDSLAWYIDFHPGLHQYSFKNAATGKYMVYDGSFKLQTSNNVPASGYFQLMKGRVDGTIRNENGNIVRRGFWIVRNEGRYDSPCLAAIENGAIRSEGFDVGNWAVTQRWLILSTDDMRHLAPAEEGDFSVLSQLKVNNVPLPEFQSERYDYDYEIDPASAITRYSIGFTKAKDFNGNVRTNRPTTIPGDGTAVATAETGEVTTYTIHFFRNHAIHWSGDGVTSYASEPYRHGWGPRLHTNWGQANSANSNAYLDPYEGNYVGYTLKNGGFKYNYHRILQLAYEKGNEEYSYTFNTLSPLITYQFKSLISMAEATRIPEITIGIRNETTGEVLAEEHFTPSINRKEMTEVGFLFDTPEDVDSDTPFTLYFKSSRGDCTLTLGDLVVTPVGEATGIQMTELSDKDLHISFMNDGKIIAKADHDKVVTIYDISGRTVLQTSITGGEMKTFSLPAGIYILNGHKMMIK